MSYGVFYTESTTNLGASETFTGPARDVGTSPGKRSEVAYFNAFFFSDQTGTASIELSVDNATWVTCATAPLNASTPLTLTIPVMARYFRVNLVNGATPQTTLVLTSGFTGS